MVEFDRKEKFRREGVEHEDSALHQQRGWERPSSYSQSGKGEAWMWMMSTSLPNRKRVRIWGGSDF